LHLPEGEIVGGGEPEITGVLDHADLGEPLLRRGYTAISGSVVHKPDFMAKVVDGIVKGRQALQQKVLCVPIDDDDGEIQLNFSFWLFSTI
jgi:hypothetical protein